MPSTNSRLRLGAPLLGSILRTNVGGVAGQVLAQVIEALAKEFDAQLTPEAVKAAIEAAPQAAAKFKRSNARRADGERAALPLTQLLTGCATTTASVGTNAVACSAFDPIRWSKKDTDDTIQEAKAHNAAWKPICNNQEPLRSLLPCGAPISEICGSSNRSRLQMEFAFQNGIECLGPFAVELDCLALFTRHLSRIPAKRVDLHDDPTITFKASPCRFDFIVQRNAISVFVRELLD